MLRFLVPLIAIALGLVGCASLDPPHVTLANVETLESQGLEERMQLTLRVQNPNEKPIVYNGIYVQLDVFDRSLASGESNASGTVPPFGETEIKVPVTISLMDVVSGAMGLLSRKSLDKVSYEMRGKLNDTTSGALRFTSRGEWALPTS